MVKFYKGVAGRRNRKAKGAVIHNDAGSRYANVAFYRNWLPSHDAELGFAHVYIAEDGRYQAEDYGNMAWHTANSDGNANYVGWEVCQSMGDEKVFRANEQKVFADVAKWMKSEGMQPNRSTVRLHQEFSATSCPHRSWALHGRSLNAVKDYYIAQILKAMKGSVPAPINPVKPSTPKTYKAGDKVKIVDSLYRDSYGSGRSTAKRGKVGTIKSESGKGGKKYLVENWGWAHPNDIQLVESAKLTPKPTLTPNKGKWIAEKGKFYPNFALPLTVNASGNGALIANIFKNQYIEYDAFMIDDKYVWIRQPRGGGKYGYMATGNAKNGKRIDYWGTFK